MDFRSMTARLLHLFDLRHWWAFLGQILSPVPPPQIFLFERFQKSVFTLSRTVSPLTTNFAALAQVTSFFFRLHLFPFSQLLFEFHFFIFLSSKTNLPPVHIRGRVEVSLQAMDSLSTKCKLQRKLKPNVTQISQPMTDGGVANSTLLIGFHN